MSSVMIVSCDRIFSFTHGKTGGSNRSNERTTKMTDRLDAIRTDCVVRFFFFYFGRK
jgi:hypothetical protein